MEHRPPRTARSSALSVLVAACAVIAAACGSASTQAGASGAGVAPAPTPRPGGAVAATDIALESAGPSSASGPASIALPADWTAFTSDRFAYSIEHPAGWSETPAATDWPATGWPAPDSEAADRFKVPGSSATQLSVSSDVLDAGEAAAGRLAEIDQESALVCQMSGISPVTIDGAEGRQNDQLCFGRDHVIQVFVDHADRIYLIYWFSRSPIPETDRAIFAAALKRFTFAD
jgi:hypothetical protein